MPKIKATTDNKIRNKQFSSGKQVVERHKQHKQASKCGVGKTVRFIVFSVKHKNAKKCSRKRTTHQSIN